MGHVGCAHSNFNNIINSLKARAGWALRASAPKHQQRHDGVKVWHTRALHAFCTKTDHPLHRLPAFMGQSTNGAIMTKTLILRGVPFSIRNDAWWLDAPTVPPAPPNTPSPNLAGSFPGGFRVLALALSALVLVADLLFWDANGAGLSLPLFLLAVFGLATASVAWRQKRAPLVLLVLCLLPAVEYVQMLSVGFALAGLVLSIILARAPGPRLFSRAGWLALRLPLWWGVGRFVRFCVALPKELPDNSRLSTGLRDWSLPIGGAMVLLYLMAQANPLIEAGLVSLINLPFELERHLFRMLFWTGVALMLAPVFGPLPQARAIVPSARAGTPVEGLWSVGSVQKALITFNAILAVQTISDIGILWGAFGLPDGMTHAEYAHRGAYPLLATAMLAGLFSLIARPFLGESRWAARLQILWLGQNMFLCASALLRLWEYVDAFGLTYLRLHAAIWMVLVAAGLILMLWQNLKARDNAWLILRGAGLGIGTLYLCSFINFAAIIASWNLHNHGLRDAGYLCNLPATAAAELADVKAREEFTAYRACKSLDPHVARDLRDWGFREWRVWSYVQATEANRQTYGQDTGR